MANEYMMVSSVTNVLSQATDWLIDLGENWIDAQLDDGLLKEIPIIKALMLGKNVIRTVTECHEIRQISQFLLTIDTECTDEARRKRYIKVFIRTTLIISKKPGNTGISRDIRTEFTTDLLLSD